MKSRKGETLALDGPTLTAESRRLHIGSGSPRSRRVRLPWLGCLLVLAATGRADQVVKDVMTDTVVLAAPSPGHVKIVDNPMLRGLIFSNSGDPNDPYAITRPGGHCNTNGDATDVQNNLGLTTYGFGCQLTGDNAVADDFVLSDWYTLEQLVFCQYQTGATSPSINRLDYALLDANPLGQGQPAWTTANSPAVTLVNVYKKLWTVAPEDPSGCTRRIQQVTVTLNPPVTLPAGHYWLAWRSAGTVGSGPWQPPVVILGQTGKPGANGLQSAAGAPFAPVLDGTHPQDLVFELYGQLAAPQPAGACCLLTGVCVPDKTRSVCEAIYAGIWQGAGTTCDPNPCPPAQGACCFPDGSCTLTSQADCTGVWLGAGVSCTPNPCPQPGPTCDNPVVVTLVTPYTDVNTTCGMGNDYSNTCLGNYDGGEDIIYKLIVTAPACLDITVTGATPADKWIGLLVDDTCPPNPTACLYSGNSGSGYTVTLGSVYLAPGVYCIMVDTWPQPNCIDFTLTITDCPGACCLPDGSCVPSTTPAACAAQGGDFQGPGTDCGPWSYTAVPCSNPLEDIAATGTHIPQAEVNDGGAPVNLPFTFSFFGVPQTSIGVSSNGYLTFGTMYGAYTPAPIPSAAPPNDLLAVLWRDLNATRPPAGGFSSRGMRPLIRPPSTPRAAPRAARSVPSRTARGS